MNAAATFERGRDVSELTAESRAAQIDREIENLVSNYAEAPSKKTSEDIFYLNRERAKVFRFARRKAAPKPLGTGKSLKLLKTR